MYPIVYALFLSIAAFAFSGCGTVTTSTLHTRSQIRDAETMTGNLAALPEATIEIGSRVKAYQSKPGLLSAYWGYIPSLMAEDPSIVKCETVPVGRGYVTYLEGLKEGVTKIYRTNGLVPAPEQCSERERVGFKNYFYTLRVESTGE